MESACDSLQAARSSANDSSSAFGREVENVILERNTDANSPLAFPTGGDPQQQLKLRFGLRQKQAWKKPTVESHPIAGTLSDVLQECRSTQSALNLHRSDYAGNGASPFPSSPLAVP